MAALSELVPVATDDVLRAQAALRYIELARAMVPTARVIHQPRVYWMDEVALPVHPGLAHLVRDGRQYARCLRAIAREYMRPEGGLTYLLAAELFERLARGMSDPHVPELVCALLPTAQCAECHEPFLRENRRQLECSDHCRRDHTRLNLHHCPLCGKPRAAEARLCQPCWHLVYREARASLPAPSGTCPRCGNRVGKRGRRYCTRACQMEGERAAWSLTYERLLAERQEVTGAR